MKTLYTKPAARIAAAMLLALTVFVGVLCITAAGLMMEHSSYIDGGYSLRQDVIRELLQQDADRLYTSNVVEYAMHPAPTDTEWLSDSLGYYNDPTQTNFLFTYYDSNHQPILKNELVEDHEALLRTFQTVFSDDAMHSITRSFPDEASARSFEDSFRRELEPNQELYSVDWVVESDESITVTISSYFGSELYLNVGLRQPLVAHDQYYLVLKALDWMTARRIELTWGALACVILSAVLLTFLIRGAGLRPGEEVIHQSWADKLPLDGFLLLVAALWILPFLGLDAWSDSGERALHRAIAISLVFGIKVIFRTLLALWLVLSLSVRWKLGTVLDRTLLSRLWQWLKRGFGFFSRNMDLVWKLFSVWLLLSGVEALAIFGLGHQAVLWLWVAEKLLLTPLCLALAMNLRAIERGGHTMRENGIAEKIDTRWMLPGLRRYAEDLNGIGQGLQQAVDQQMRSERMKAELITNVSHDIKTPLTSIVNYVNLLRTKGLDSPDAPEYLEVLERQSDRLKKLVVDLVEASKASTGSMPVNPEPTDVRLLLQQAAGEYSERLEAQQIQAVLDLAEELPLIQADPELLWRVFDNLLHNACKYTQPLTRVYLTAAMVEGKVQIVFRNVSSAPLNIAPRELMERFVRGDASRHTEGSGLGLAIAQSLTQLQGGEFDLTIDGDLFKVTLAFPPAADAPAGEDEKNS